MALDFRMAAHTGVGTYLRNLVPRLPGVDPALELLLLVPSSIEIPAPLPPRTEVLPWPDAPAIHSLREQVELPALLSAAGTRVDVLHVPHFHAPLFAGPPLVITAHDLILIHHPEELPHLAARAYARLFWALVVRRARRILTVSHFVADDLAATLGVGRDKLIVAPHGPPDETPLPTREDITRVRHAYALGEEYVLSVGMQRPRKNLPRLVRAFARTALPGAGVKLVLAGPPDPRGAPIEDAVRACDLEGKVIQPGFVPSEDLPALYAGAAFFAFPSLHEGWGFPALEAFRNGTAVAAARASALPEVCGDAALWFDPEDEADIARALTEMSEDGALRKRLVREGMRRVAGMTWDESARATVRAYREAIA